MLTPHDIKRYTQGQITATGATEATLVVKNLDADSVVILSLNTVGGTPAAPYVSSKNVTTNTIGIKSGASDTSVYDVIVFP